MTKRAPQAGYSLVEMIVVLVMTGIIATIIFAVSYQYLKNAASLESRSNFFSERITLSDFIRQNIGYSTGLQNQNGVADDAPLIVEPSDTTGKHWVILHAIPGVKKTSEAQPVVPLIYYTMDALDRNRKIIANDSQAYQNDYVMYLYGAPPSELRVRTLASPDAPDNIAKTSCLNQTPTCSKDKVLLTGVESVTMKYFSRAGETIDFTNATDPITGEYMGLDFENVEVAEFHVKVKKPIESDKNHFMYNTTVVRIAIRNV